MPWSAGTFSRTDGTRTGTTVWTQARDAGVNILAADHDTHDQDIATGINSTLAKDGSNAPSADLPMGTYKHTGVGNGTARNHYLAVGQFQDGAVTYAATGGSSNAYTLTLSPAITAYVTGMTLQIEPNHTNTGAATINVNSVGAKSIKDVYGAALIGNELQSGGIYTICYDGTDFLLVNTASLLRTVTIKKAAVSITHGTWTQCAFDAADVVTDPAGLADAANEKIVLPTNSTAALVTLATQYTSSGIDSIGVTVGYSPVANTPGTGGATNFVQRASNHDTLPGSGTIFHTAVSHIFTVPNPGSTNNGSYDVYGSVYVDITAGSGSVPIAWELSVAVLR